MVRCARPLALYVASWADAALPGSTQALVHVAGVVELLIGLTLVFRPRLGGVLAAVWLSAVVVNLLTGPGLYDIALRNVGLVIAAVALVLLQPGGDDRWTAKGIARVSGWAS